MTQCPTCAARAQSPETLSDVLLWAAPPPSLLTFLDRYAARSSHPPTPEFEEWRAKWAAINEGAPVPAVDQFE